ncbi:MAG: hypothetical protein HGA95_00095 [Caldiserica bacterium]|nr:hypothetical protein [Caldisericota bacterium]
MNWSWVKSSIEKPCIQGKITSEQKHGMLMFAEDYQKMELGIIPKSESYMEIVEEMVKKECGLNA